MVHVTQTKHWDFEIPDSCIRCPMKRSFQDGNATISSCALKHDPDWVKNTISYSSQLSYECSDVVYFRDKNCPLVDGKSYTI